MSCRWILPLLLVAAVMTIGAPVGAQAPNITYKYDASLMMYPLTPTTANPTPVPATVPATLPGNTQAIYWNLLGHNNGTASTTAGVGGTTNVDGQGISTWGSPGPIYPGNIISGWNKGPFTVRGGRHTMEAVFDNQDLIFESDETDNWWAHQYVFTPYDLIDSLPVVRGTPPDRMGGIFSIVDGSPVDFNCDGFRFSSSGWWNAVTVHATDLTDDYDLDLFTASTGSENGFIGSTTSSNALAGKLDALIVNRNMTGFQVYDAGVTNYSGLSNFVIEHVTSGVVGMGADMTVSFDTDEHLKIWDANMSTTGWIQVAVTDSMKTGCRFKVGLLDHDVTEIGLSEVLWWNTMDDNGEVRLHQDITVTGYYGLVIYRDPSDGSFPLDLNVKVELMPPDPMTFTPAHWNSALVPTPVPSPPSMSIALPDTLYGYMPQTYINFGVQNNSFATSPAMDVAVYQDGMDHWPIHYPAPSLGTLGVYECNETIGREIPGGRHALTLELDYTESIYEVTETNNIYTEQYCWSPLELFEGQQYGYQSPGPYNGGWTTLDPSEPWIQNCDGYRIATGGPQWEGMVLTQGPNSDYDLDFHHPLVGVKNGFDDFLAGSNFPQGETDYLLVNNHVLAPDVYDVGVVNIVGSEGYTVEAVGSTTLPQPTHGRHGPYSMPISNMLHIYDIYLVPDIYAFRVDNLGPAVDWGMDLHHYTNGLMGRNDAMPGASSYLAGPGQGEFFTISITDAGWYGLAVYKATSDGFDRDGQYQLTILMGISDVDDSEDVPAATALKGAHPNPFNPQTTISFDLAASGAVDLEIYDVKGAMVRRLVDESMTAGRHSVVWNGETDSGERVASGVYLARFRSGQYREVGKLVMLK